jgi:4-hydroxy-tetrahydrodipicolinate reductase
MTRRYALFGTGKTGSQLPGLLGADEQVTQFNQSNPLSAEALAGHDAVICFVPGQVMLDAIPLLIESRLPVISGATGLSYPENLDEQLQSHGLTWVWAHNFALGMSLVRQLIQLVASADSLLENPDYQIHEIHHTAKLDAPSGTSISWQHWLDKDVEITHDRVGDVIGEHQLTLNTASEQITIEHKALDRAIFARGALWACRKVLDTEMPAGLIPFEQLTSAIINSHNHAR